MLSARRRFVSGIRIRYCVFGEKRRVIFLHFRRPISGSASQFFSRLSFLFDSSSTFGRRPLLVSSHSTTASERLSNWFGFVNWRHCLRYWNGRFERNRRRRRLERFERLFALVTVVTGLKRDIEKYLHKILTTESILIGDKLVETCKNIVFLCENKLRAHFTRTVKLFAVN